jgi:hypothetical protein
MARGPPEAAAGRGLNLIPAYTWRPPPGDTGKRPGFFSKVPGFTRWRIGRLTTEAREDPGGGAGAVAVVRVVVVGAGFDSDHDKDNHDGSLPPPSACQGTPYGQLAGVPH